MARNVETHVTGLGFPEGPVVLPDGSIAFVDLLHGKVRTYRDGAVAVLADLPGSPNGMRLGPDGALYICNNGGIAPVSLDELSYADPQVAGCLQRLEPDGSWSTHVENLPGEPPSRPNDLVFTPAGDIVFTDPQNWEVLGVDDAAYRGGQLLLAPKNGGGVRKLSDMTGFPNGLAFHPDGSLLVGITMEHRIMRFEWLGDGVGAVSEWCRLGDTFNPDGMIFHEGRLYCTGSSGDAIAVIDQSGQVLETIDTGAGSDPTNLCVHDGRLWVTFGLPGELRSYSLEA